jgi:hypothetical protein
MNLEQKLLWLVIGVGVGYLLFYEVRHVHHYGAAAAAPSTVTGEPLTASTTTGSAPFACGCQG